MDFKLIILIGVLIGCVIVYIIYDIINSIFFKSKDGNTNADGLISKKGIVIKDISYCQAGYVKVLGREWLATSQENLLVGDYVIVKAFDGGKMVVEKYKNEDNSKE